MLSDVEYQEILERRRVLEGIIEGAERDKDKYQDMKKIAIDKIKDAGARLLLYDNFLSDAVKEYEDAHPPEELK